VLTTVGRTLVADDRDPIPVEDDVPDVELGEILDVHADFGSGDRAGPLDGATLEPAADGLGARTPGQPESIQAKHGAVLELDTVIPRPAGEVGDEIADLRRTDDLVARGHVRGARRASDADTDDHRQNELAHDDPPELHLSHRSPREPLSRKFSQARRSSRRGSRSPPLDGRDA